MEDFDLWYVWAGHGRMWWADQEVELSSGTCLWLRPGSQYMAEHDPERPLGVTYIHFTAKDKYGSRLTAEQVPGTCFEVGDPTFFAVSAAKVVRLLREVDVWQGKRDTSLLKRRATHLFGCLIDELLSVSQETEAGVGSRYRIEIERQLAIIYERPADVPRVAELAREVGLSPDHYTRVFRALIGRSPRALIQAARLDRARQLMRESALSLSEIAEQTGYSDVFQFSRLFKSQMGVSPSRWRRVLAGPDGYLNE